jgi:hypothetical protein
MHRTLNLVYVTPVTYPWGLRPTFIVAVSTVHSLCLQLYIVSCFRQVHRRLFAHPVILTYNWRDLPPHSLYVYLARWLAPSVVWLNCTVYLVRFQRGRSVKLLIQLVVEKINYLVICLHNPLLFPVVMIGTACIYRRAEIVNSWGFAFTLFILTF